MKFRPTLFWDVDPKTIHPKKHARYIAERIMNYGRDNEVRWLLGNYSRRYLGQVVKKSRDLDNHARSLWTLLLKQK